VTLAHRHRLPCRLGSCSARASFAQSLPGSDQFLRLIRRRLDPLLFLTLGTTLQAGLPGLIRRFGPSCARLRRAGRRPVTLDTRSFGVSR
jgi:hypothetical protein